ncbi:hypothetical protein [Oceanicoccus sp. KOV_DT_Chl]|uniref:hypothetical protein n=1 Tax=Oceanicoccus sp. KOV_DT_Chl TaxID=1904639 RepID=UPI0011AF56E5|nr:hypothetical protein [Oceanicoccus sp. KOV_DT_Chl]
MIDGTGFIRQTSEGLIEFRLIFGANPDRLNIHRALQFLDTAPSGTLVPATHYFDLVASDVGGSTWKASNLYLGDKSIYVSQNTAVITGNIRQLVLVASGETGLGDSVQLCNLFVKGDFKLPYNEFQDNGEKGSSLCKLRMSIDDVDIEFNNNNNVLGISFSIDIKILLETYESNLRQAVSILLGVDLPVMYSIKRTADSAETSIFSSERFASGKLSGPLKTWMPYQHEDMRCFVEAYIKAAEGQDLNRLFGYWHKIFVVSNSTIEASSLACGVAVEGVVKQYFKGLFPAEQGKIDLIGEAKIVVSDIDIDSVIRTQLMSALGNYQSKSPKSVLYVLCDRLGLDKKIVNSWSKLRNKTAHADDVDMPKHKYEEYFQQYQSAMYLFYRLTFLIIGYQGGCIDYSTIGCPDVIVRKIDLDSA